MSASSISKFQRWHIEVGGAGLLVLITLLGVVLVIKPTARALAASEVAQEEIIAQQTTVTQMTDVHRQLKNQLASIQENLKNSWVQLQPVKYLNARMAQIVEVATGNNLVIDESWSSEAEAGLDYQTVVITLSGTGRYPDSAAFLRSINNLLHDVSVVGFELSGNPDSASAHARFRFELVWYAAPIAK